MALFTVGTTAPDATLFELGYLNKKEIAKLQKESVGDVVSQFVDADGQIVDPALTARTVALRIDQVKEKRQAVLVAGGVAKVPAIRAALAGRYANVLVTDTNVALHLIDE